MIGTTPFFQDANLNSCYTYLCANPKSVVRAADNVGSKMIPPPPPTLALAGGGVMAIPMSGEVSEAVVVRAAGSAMQGPELPTILAMGVEHDGGGSLGVNLPRDVQTADDLRKALVLKGMTQGELAEGLGMTPSAICNWLTNRKIPIGQLSKINAFLQGKPVPPLSASISPLRKFEMMVRTFLPESIRDEISVIHAIGGGQNKFVIITNEGKTYELTLEATIKERK